MLFALISAITGAGALVADKLALSRIKIGINRYIPLLFLFLFAVTAVLVPSLGYVNWDVVFLPNMLFLVFLMIVVAIAWNVLFYQSLEKESVYEHEMITMTGPLVTILLAAVFFPEEFDGRIFIAGLIASVALIFARVEKRHLHVTKTTYNLFLAVILMSLESIIIRELLFSYSPVALYALRTFVLAVFFLSYYRPRWRQLNRHGWSLILISALLGAAQMLTRFYAFDALGVIFTTIVAVIGPIIVFFASWEILHERIRSRVIFSSAVILATVTFATLAAAS